VDNQGHVSIKGQRMSCGDIDLGSLGSDCFVVGQGDHYEIYRTEEWERVTASEIGGESDQ